jgi:hypothetical protein
MTLRVTLSRSTSCASPGVDDVRCRCRPMENLTVLSVSTERIGVGEGGQRLQGQTGSTRARVADRLYQPSWLGKALACLGRREGTRGMQQGRAAGQTVSCSLDEEGVRRKHIAQS